MEALKLHFTSSSAFLFLLFLLVACHTQGIAQEKKAPVNYAISLKHGDEHWESQLERRKNKYISKTHIVKDSASGMVLRAFPLFHDLVNEDLQKHLNHMMDSVAETFIGDKKTHCYYKLQYMDDTLLSFMLTSNVDLTTRSYRFYNYNLVTGKKLLIDDFFQKIAFRETLMRYAKLYVGFANTLPREDTLTKAWKETVSRARKKVVPGMFDNFSFNEQQFQFYLCTECTDKDRNSFKMDVYFFDPAMGAMLDPKGTGKYLLNFEKIVKKKK